MEAAIKHLQFEEFVAHISTIFEEMERQGTSVIVEREGKLYTLKAKAPASRGRKKLTAHDSLFTLAGIGASAEPTDIAKHKDEYLADAYTKTHQP